MDNQKRTCLICGITDRRTFMFPQGTSVEEKLRFDTWLKFAMESNPPDERLQMKSKRLCIIHFEDKYITDPYRQNKVRNAVPTLLEGSPEKTFSSNAGLRKNANQNVDVRIEINKNNNNNSVNLGTSGTDSRATDNEEIFATGKTELAFKDLPKCSDDAENMDTRVSSDSQTLLRENTINSSPQTLKVLRDQKLKDPSKIKSFLDKLRLKKKGAVFVLPLKKKCNLQNLTKDRLEHLIESMPTEDLNLKNRLLKILRGKKMSYKHLSPCGKRTLGRARGCLCTSHCKKHFPQIDVKIDGWNSSGVSAETVENSKNLFTVSASLSNIQDKGQIERLCQLVVESLYRLKNASEDAAMSKLEIYLSHESGISSTSDGIKATSESPSHSNQSQVIFDFCNQKTSSHENDKLCPSSEKNMPIPQNKGTVSSLSKINEKETDLTVDTKQHITVDLNFYHDHSYLSLDSQVLFEKTPYIVKLISADTFKSASKKTRIFKRPSLETTRKMQNEFIKLRGQADRLKKLLKKKNDNIQLFKEKVRYLGDVLRKEKGLKRIRYPRYITSSHSEPLLENEMSIFEEELNETKERKTKKKLVLTPSLEVPSCDIENSGQAALKTSDVNLNDSLDYFYDRFLEECIEEG